MLSNIFRRITAFSKVFVFKNSLIKPLQPVRAFSQDASRLTNTKEWLSEFYGGSVSLNRADPDISVVKWSHNFYGNAFTGSMMAKLDDVVCDLESSPPKAVIFFSVNGPLCSGMDKRFMDMTANHEDGKRIAEFMHVSFFNVII